MFVVVLYQTEEGGKTAKNRLDMNALDKSLETLLSRAKPGDNSLSYTSTTSQTLPHPSILDQQHRYSPTHPLNLYQVSL